MKKDCNTVCEILVGRHIHPISSIVGGFTKVPTPEALDKMLKILKDMREDMDATVALAATLTFPTFSRETEYVALVRDDDKWRYMKR